MRNVEFTLKVGFASFRNHTQSLAVISPEILGYAYRRIERHALLESEGNALQIRVNLERLSCLRSHQVVTLSDEERFGKSQAYVYPLRIVRSFVRESRQRISTWLAARLICAVCPADLPGAAFVTGACGGATIGAAVATITATGADAAGARGA